MGLVILLIGGGLVLGLVIGRWWAFAVPGVLGVWAGLTFTNLEVSAVWIGFAYAGLAALGVLGGFAARRLLRHAFR